jgi:CRISPR/Cas system CSM-associated protein Csm2 small subunit
VPLGVLVDSLSARGCLSNERERQMKDLREIVVEILESLIDNADPDQSDVDRYRAWSNAALKLRNLKHEIEKERDES